MDSPTVLSLFSGIGGLDLAVKLILPGSRVVGFVERDAYAAAVLMARMEDATLEPAPVYVGDIRDLDASGISADWVVGGFPCQDISVAGKGAGLSGSRSGLWWEMLRIIGEVRPKYIYLENVPAITLRGGLEVIGALAEIGYDAEWLTLRASDVGAPHRRERWFCLAHNSGIRLSRFAKGQEKQENTYDDSKKLGDAGVLHRPNAQQGGSLSQGLNQGWQKTSRARDAGEVLPNADRDKLRLKQGRSGGESRKRTLESRDMGTFPPGPEGKWDGVPEYLTPAIEPSFCVLVDGAPLVVDQSRSDQLRCCGNAVVSLQAAVALRELLRRVKRKSNDVHAIKAILMGKG